MLLEKIFSQLIIFSALSCFQEPDKALMAKMIESYDALCAQEEQYMQLLKQIVASFYSMKAVFFRSKNFFKSVVYCS